MLFASVALAAAPRFPNIPPGNIISANDYCWQKDIPEAGTVEASFTGAVGAVVADKDGDVVD